jgi:hypothetical protein
MPPSHPHQRCPHHHHNPQPAASPAKTTTTTTTTATTATLSRSLNQAATEIRTALSLPATQKLLLVIEEAAVLLGLMDDIATLKSLAKANAIADAIAAIEAVRESVGVAAEVPLAQVCV